MIHRGDAPVVPRLRTTRKIALMRAHSLPAVLTTLLIACGAPPTAPTVRVVDYGIVRLVGPFERHADPNTAVGYTSSGPGRSTFEKATRDIPAVQGCAFGFRYRIEGAPDGQRVTVEEIIRHPPMRRPDGTMIREERTKEEWLAEDGAVDRKFLYRLSQPYEVVPGDWTLTVTVNGKTAVEQHFNLIASK